MAELADLEHRLGHVFSDPELLYRALCHRSWVAEHPDDLSNERLEFLGDAVLGWVTADLAFRRDADYAEGTLTDLRKAVVNARALAGVARALNLGEHIRLGRGEAAAGGADKDSILSDAVEAVIGAVYLDGGVDTARDLVTRLIGPLLDAAPDDLSRLDPKSTLQERLAAVGSPAPVYEVTGTGPDHDRWFTAIVMSGSRELASGEGRSRKQAEAAAAAAALDVLD